MFCNAVGKFAVAPRVCTVGNADRRFLFNLKAHIFNKRLLSLTSTFMSSNSFSICLQKQPFSRHNRNAIDIQINTSLFTFTPYIFAPPKRRQNAANKACLWQKQALPALQQRLFCIATKACLPQKKAIMGKKNRSPWGKKGIFLNCQHLVVVFRAIFFFISNMPRFS